MTQKTVCTDQAVRSLRISTGESPMGKTAQMCPATKICVVIFSIFR
jgi:hypothetical protein